MIMSSHDCSLGQRVTRKTATEVRLINEDPCLYCWILIHNTLRVLQAGVENANPFDVAAINQGTNDRQHSLIAEFKISSPMLPNKFVHSLLVPLRAGAQNHNAIGFGCCQHVLHEF